MSFPDPSAAAVTESSISEEAIPKNEHDRGSYREPRARGVQDKRVEVRARTYVDDMVIREVWYVGGLCP